MPEGGTQPGTAERKEEGKRRKSVGKKITNWPEFFWKETEKVRKNSELCYCKKNSGRLSLWFALACLLAVQLLGRCAALSDCVGVLGGRAFLHSAFSFPHSSGSVRSPQPSLARSLATPQPFHPCPSSSSLSTFHRLCPPPSPPSRFKSTQSHRRCLLQTSVCLTSTGSHSLDDPCHHALPLRLSSGPAHTSGLAFLIAPT